MNDTKPASRILIFGGSFNPPTIAHAAIIRACLKLEGFDQLWIMPSGKRTDKAMIADRHRLRMLEIMKNEEFAENPRLHVSDFELRLPRPTQTYNTVKALEAHYPDTTFWFVFGEDSLQSMPTWDHGHELAQKLQLILFARGKNRHKQLGSYYIELPKTYRAVSSTAVRQMIASGRSAERYVNRQVLAYIHAHRLYT